VVTCWAALGRHSPRPAIVIALICGLLYAGWLEQVWPHTLPRGRPPSMPRTHFLETVILLGSFLVIRSVGFRLVPNQRVHDKGQTSE
jgi:hypothetical protein